MDSIIVIVIYESVKFVANETNVFVAVVGANAFFAQGSVKPFYVGIIVRVADSGVSRFNAAMMQSALKVRKPTTSL